MVQSLEAGASGMGLRSRSYVTSSNDVAIFIQPPECAKTKRWLGIIYDSTDRRVGRQVNSSLNKKAPRDDIMWRDVFGWSDGGW